MSAEVYVEGDYYAQVPEWLLSENFSSNAVKLYAILRRYADKSTLLAHPSRKTLAERMGFSKAATVDAPIKELIDKGAMETFVRWRTDKDGKRTGERSSNGYRLYTKQVVPKNGLPPEEGITGSPVEGTTVVPEKGLGVVPETGQLNHSQLEPQSREPQSEGTTGESFARFWAIYPRKDDKAIAKKKFPAALKKASLDEILAGAEQYRDDPNRDPSFTKLAATWLNAEAWDNGPLPPRNQEVSASDRRFQQDLQLVQSMTPSEYGQVFEIGGAHGTA